VKVNCKIEHLFNQISDNNERKGFKMKKRMFSLFFAGVMVLMCSIPAFAASSVTEQGISDESNLSFEERLSDLDFSKSTICVSDLDGFSITYSGTNKASLFSQNKFSLRKSSIGVNVTIEVRDAEELQNFSATISKGYSIDYVRHLYTQQPLDGSIAIYDEAGEPIVATSEPVAYDADGVRVPIEFDLLEQGFITEITYDGNILYPLTVEYNWENVSAFSSNANEYKIEDFWTEYYGHNRDNGYCFTFGGRLFPCDSTRMMVNRSWFGVTNYFGNDPEWYNEEGLYDQYMCHADTVLFQQIAGDATWDIEPWRPSVGSLLTMLNACNP